LLQNKAFRENKTVVFGMKIAVFFWLEEGAVNI